MYKAVKTAENEYKVVKISREIFYKVHAAYGINLIFINILNSSLFIRCGILKQSLLKMLWAVITFSNCICIVLIFYCLRILDRK